MERKQRCVPDEIFPVGKRKSIDDEDLLVLVLKKEKKEEEEVVVKVVSTIASPPLSCFRCVFCWCRCRCVLLLHKMKNEAKSEKRDE